MNGLMRCFFISVMLFLLISVKGQSDFRPGYIISNNNDSISGIIDYRGDYLMGHQCTFINADGEKFVYTPYDIKEYRFYDSKYYVSRDVNNEKVFLEFLINGKICIYYLRNKNGDHYYIEKDNEPLVEIPFKEDYVVIDGKAYWVNSTKHIGLLNYYTQDAPTVRTKINKIKEPTHDNLISVARDYHNVVCNDKECVIYERKIPAVKLSLEPKVGLFVPLGEYKNDGLCGEYGIMAHIWLPRQNEKLYLKTGLLIWKMNSGILFKVPFHFEYIYPKGTVRPKFSGGINIYVPAAITDSYSAGMNVKLSDNIFLSVDYEIEFFPHENVFLIPRKLMGNSFHLGCNIIF